MNSPALGPAAGTVTPIRATLPDQGVAKHRSAERFNLMLRVAKLVSTHGEYACVIRDVSTTGVRLRLFHSLPAERHLALILGNGECYFLENVWAHEREAGFRFSAPINIPAFITESSRYPRRQVRLGMALPATLSIREFSTPVMIRDLSQNGARIESERTLMIDQHVRLKARGIPEIFASVRWKSGADHGLVFQQSFRLDALAELAWDIAEPAERTAAHLAAQSPAAQPAAASLTPAAHLRAG